MNTKGKASIAAAYQNKGECQVCGDYIQVGDLYIRSKEIVGFLHAEYCGEDEADWDTWDEENYIDEWDY